MKFIFDTQVHLQNICVMFVYQGHRVKFKITGAERVCVCCWRVVCVQLNGDLVIDSLEHKKMPGAP